MSFPVVVTWLSRILVGNAFTYIFSLGILLFAVVCLITFILETHRIGRDLDRALSALRETKSTPPSFVPQFERLNQRLQGIRSVNECWSQFRETLLFPSADEPNGTIANVIEPSRFFNEQSILGSAINLRLYSAVPNWLTGLGIFGTFLGLFAGIYLAQAGLAQNDPLKTQTALMQLLSGAALAFLTSIAGLFGSLAFAVVEKRTIHAIAVRIGQFADALDQRLVHTTAEKLAHAHLAEARRQTDQLARFNTELVIHIGQALEEKVANRLSASLQTLITSVDRMAAARADTDQQLLQSLVAEFRSAMSGSAGQEFEGLAHMLRELSTTVAGASADMRRGQEQLQSTTLQMATQVGSALSQSTSALQQGLADTLNNTVDRLQSASQNMAASLESAGQGAASRLDTSGAGFAESIQRLATVTADLRTSIDSLPKVVSEAAKVTTVMREIVSGLAAATSPLAATGQSLSRASDASRQAMDSAAQLTQQLHGALQRIEAMQAETRKSWTDYALRFEGLDRSAKGVFSEIDTGLTAFTRRVSEFMTSLDDQLAKATQNLVGAIQQFEEQLDVLNDSLDRLGTVDPTRRTPSDPVVPGGRR